MREPSLKPHIPATRVKRRGPVLRFVQCSWKSLRSPELSHKLQNRRTGPERDSNFRVGKSKVPHDRRVVFAVVGNVHPVREQ